MGKDFGPHDLRQTLAKFGTGVTIVTARDEAGNPIGMTASSFNSVSMDPPLVLWSVTKAALSGSAFKDAKHFAIHVLAADQSDVSNRFAKSGEDKFGGSDVSFDENNVPILPDVAARFDCSAWAAYEGGDHWIIVGKVEGVEQSNGRGLLFVDGGYAIAAPFPKAFKAGERLDNGSDAPINDMLQYALSRAYHQMIAGFHDIVEANGLTVPEWRIASSLFGGTSFDSLDLAGRTFLEPAALEDILFGMQERGFCTLTRDDDQLTVVGTAKGDERVQHLYDLAKAQETKAMSGLDPEIASGLKDALKALAKNGD